MIVSCTHLSRGSAAPQRRLLLVLALLLSSATPANAITLRQHFGELSDRDRGVYLTGFMDLLRSDPQRESAFLECVQREGPQRLHAILADMVRQEPQILVLEVAPWFFYAVHSLCPQAGKVPRPSLQPATEEHAAPSAIASEPADSAAWALPAAVALLAVLAAAIGLRRRRITTKRKEISQ